MKKKILKLINENTLMIYYIVSSILLGLYLRAFTVGKIFYLKPLIFDLGITVIVSFFINFFKTKTQKILYLIFILLSTILCFINAMYYENYTSYASISFISTAMQLDRIESGSLLSLLDFKKVFYFLPLIGYLCFVSKQKVQASKKSYKSVIIAIILMVIALFWTSSDSINKFWTQWKREYNVMHFGIYAYQINDFFTSLEPKIFQLNGYDLARNNFNDYFKNQEVSSQNKYTDIFKGKNVLAIHAESIQTFLLDLKVGGKEVTPNLKKFSQEGLYFSNFYAQESVGTSSDSEFTYSTSLLPSTSGTVFVNYADRKFISIQKLLSQQGYYTFSMHGNNADFWNRDVMHKNLGYNIFYDASGYNIDEFVGLGLSDKSFFRQSIEKIKAIDAKNQKYYGTLIMLTNHTPFTSLSDNGLADFDLTYEINGITDNHLEDTKIGHYLESAHYADQAIGEFISALDKEGLLENTVIVIYGDHDAKLGKNSYELLYNYDAETGKLKDKDSENYINIDQNWIDLNRKVPFIVWSKDMVAKEEVSEAMGMIDVLPTLGNMLGIKNKYQLGHDIFSTSNNIVVFPKGNWLTNKIYFDAQREEYYQIDHSTSISLEEIEKNNQYANEIIRLSNDIIKYNLLIDLAF